MKRTAELSENFSRPLRGLIRFTHSNPSPDNSGLGYCQSSRLAGLYSDSVSGIHRFKLMKPNEPLVSIGIPTHNRASQLKTAFESVLAQDYSPIEIIISDNASTDETESLCRDWSEKYEHVRYLRRPVNEGQIVNLAEVMLKSRGDFFMWLADDDWLDANYVSSCVKVLCNNPDYVSVCGRTKYFRNKLHVYDAPLIDFLAEEGARRVASYYGNLLGNEMFYGIVRSEVIRKTLPFQNVMGFDCLITSSIAFQGQIKTIGDTNINRELGGTSETPEKMASILGLSWLRAKFYYENIAWHAFCQIVWQSRVYESLSVWQRLRLATACGFGIWKKHILPNYFQRFAPRLIVRATYSARYRCRKAWHAYLGE